MTRQEQTDRASACLEPLLAGTPAAGQPAPNFRLPWRLERTFELRRFLGRPIILAFYTNDWEPVSTDQLMQYQENLAAFNRFGAELVSISVDGLWSHLAFARQYAFTFPLLADNRPQGRVARLYGVYREAEGTSQRALFVINPLGRIAWSEVAPACVNPGIDGVLTALEKPGSTR